MRHRPIPLFCFTILFALVFECMASATVDRSPDLDVGGDDSEAEPWFERLQSASRPRMTEGVHIDRIVAWVDEEAVTLTELEEAMAGYQSENIVEPGPPTEERLRASCERWIDEVLILRAALESGVKAPPETIDRRVAATFDRLMKQYGGATGLDAVLQPAGYDANTLRERIHEQLRRDWVIAAAVGRRVIVTDQEVEGFTEERRRKGLPTERYHLSQVLIPVSDQALDRRWESVMSLAHDLRLAVVDRPDFIAAAREWVRRNPGEDAQVDSLGTLDPGELLRPLADAVAHIAPGATTPPVRTAKGVHVLYLHRKTTARDMLFAQQFEKAWREWADTLRRNADIQRVRPILDRP